MKNLNNKFSIITSIYNGDLYLNNYFNQIYNQKLKPFEIIIIDDGNNKLLNKFVQKYKKKNLKIKIIKNKKNLGSAKSLNKGINKAKTKILFRLDVDDLWNKNHTQTCMSIINKYPNFGLYSQKIDLNFLQKNTDDNYHVNRNTLIHSSWVLNLNILNSFRYTGGKKQCEDYMTLTKYLLSGLKIYYFKKITVLHNNNHSGHGIKNSYKVELARKQCSIKLFNFYKNKSSSLISFIFFKFGFFPFLYFLYRNYI